MVIRVVLCLSYNHICGIFGNVITEVRLQSKQAERINLQNEIYFNNKTENSAITGRLDYSTIYSRLLSTQCDIEEVCRQQHSRIEPVNTIWKGRNGKQNLFCDLGHSYSEEDAALIIHDELSQLCTYHEMWKTKSYETVLSGFMMFFVISHFTFCPFLHLAR